MVRVLFISSLVVLASCANMKERKGEAGFFLRLYPNSGSQEKFATRKTWHFKRPMASLNRYRSASGSSLFNASYGVKDAVFAVVQLAQTTMCSELKSGRVKPCTRIICSIKK